MSVTPAKPPHGRKLGLSGTALTLARNPKGDVAALTAIRDELEARLIAVDFFADAPFSWVTISIRYGLKNEETPHFQPIHDTYGDLPLSIEVAAAAMADAGFDALKALFRLAALRALLAAAARYSRPDEVLHTLLAAASRDPHLPH
ncbi:MAG: Imm39 family immunity protein [Planctomycetota bacterium]